MLPRQICCGPFTNLTKNLRISLYFLNRPAGRLRMRLTVLTLTAGSVLPKTYGSLNSARVLVRVETAPVAEFEAIGEDPEKFNAFVNAAETKTKRERNTSPALR